MPSLLKEISVLKSLCKEKIESSVKKCKTSFRVWDPGLNSLFTLEKYYTLASFRDIQEKFLHASGSLITWGGPTDRFIEDTWSNPYTEVYKGVARGTRGTRGFIDYT